ncbi:MAG TPA: hypothetical protein ENN09_00260 [Planctomycetes bacterium]|nr:hypothetical protein [Planctomycetota bacterium]
MKVQADDQMLVWVDGKLAYRHDHQQPVTRAAYAVPVILEEGVHRVRIRVNQLQGRWQASLRFRTEDDGISGIIGLPASAVTQAVDAPPGEW